MIPNIEVPLPTICTTLPKLRKASAQTLSLEIFGNELSQRQMMRAFLKNLPIDIRVLTEKEQNQIKKIEHLFRARVQTLKTQKMYRYADKLRSEVDQVFSRYRFQNEVINTIRPLDQVYDELINHFEGALFHSVKKIGEGYFGTVYALTLNAKSRFQLYHAKKLILERFVKTILTSNNPLALLREGFFEPSLLFALNSLKLPFCFLLSQDKEIKEKLLNEVEAYFSAQQLGLENEIREIFLPSLTEKELYTFFLQIIKLGRAHNPLFLEILQKTASSVEEVFKKNKPLLNVLRKQKKVAHKTCSRSSLRAKEDFKDEASYTSYLLPCRYHALSLLKNPAASLYLKYAESGDALDFFIAPKNKNPLYLKAFHIDVLKGLFYLHEQNIVHRDVALRNILVQKVDHTARFMLCDFGFAEVIFSYETKPWDRSGKPPIEAPPEIVKEKIFCQKSDLFMAAICFSLLLLDPKEWKRASTDFLKKRLESNDLNPDKIKELFGVDDFSGQQYLDLLELMLKDDPNERPISLQALLVLIDQFQYTNNKQGNGH